MQPTTSTSVSVKALDDIASIVLSLEHDGTVELEGVVSAINTLTSFAKPKFVRGNTLCRMTIAAGVIALPVTFSP